MTVRTELQEVSDWVTVPSLELEERSRTQLYDFRRSYERAGDDFQEPLGEEVFDLASAVDPGRHNRPLNVELTDRVKELLIYRGAGMFLSEDYAWLAEADLNRFDVIRSAKAETSAHGVFFGLLSNPDTKQALPIAVKPCVDNPSKAYADWLNNNLIARTGRRYFEPIGFILDSDRAYSITKIEPGVETLDNTDWRQVLLDPQNPRYVGQREQLGDLSVALADLHQERIFHGDPQFKNIATDPAGNTFFIDWESAQFFGESVSAETQLKKAKHDLKILYFSMAAPDTNHGVGLLSSYDRHLQWEHFNTFILTPYIERRFELDDSDEAIERISDIETSLKEYVLQEFSIKSMRKFLRTEAA